MGGERVALRLEQDSGWEIGFGGDPIDDRTPLGRVRMVGEHAVDSCLEAVQGRDVDRWRHEIREERPRTPAHDRDSAVALGQPAEEVQRSRGGQRTLGVLHDRGERPVEVEEERRRGGVGADRRSQLVRRHAPNVGRE